MTTRHEVLAAARQRIVLDGKCPNCLCDLVEGPDSGVTYCPRCMDVVYWLDGEMLGPIV